MIDPSRCHAGDHQLAVGLDHQVTGNARVSVANPVPRNVSSKAPVSVRRTRTPGSTPKSRCRRRSAGRRGAVRSRPGAPPMLTEGAAGPAPRWGAAERRVQRTVLQEPDDVGAAPRAAADEDAAWASTPTSLRSRRRYRPGRQCRTPGPADRRACSEAQPCRSTAGSTTTSGRRPPRSCRPPGS